MQPDPRLSWCREKIDGFKEANDHAEQARAEEAENKRQMAPYMTQQQIEKFRPEVGK